MSVCAVVLADGGPRELVRTCDSVSRQDGIEERFVAAPFPADSPVLVSIETRLNTAIARGSTLAGAVNAAVRQSKSQFVLLLPSGYRPAPSCVRDCAAQLTRLDGYAAVAPSLAWQMPDGTRRLASVSFETSVPLLVARPGAAPPVLLVRRDAWDRIGGLDEAAGVVSPLDLAVQLIEAGGIWIHPAAVVVRDAAAPEVWPPGGDRDAYLAGYRYLLEKHRAVLENVMSEVLIQQEIGFGVLRDRHRELLAECKRDLAALDQLRSETAHIEAWLAHHRRNAFDWGDLRRTNPVSREWGNERGTPLDRWYIERFLTDHSSDVKGTVLEVQENDYTRAFGGPRVSRSDVLDLDETNLRATVVADLRCAPHLASDQYDAVVLTQTLHVIDDIGAVVREVHRILKPGGTVLATLPCASRVCVEYGDGGDLWRVTPDGARRLFESAFQQGAVHVVPYGNVLTNVAFLEGLAAHELEPEEYDVTDPSLPALVGVRAVKTTSTRRPTRGVVLLYHRVGAQADPHRLTVHPATFESHLELLRATCTVLPLDTLLGTPVHELPERAVAITFDDGYVDNLQIAVPALERFGCPATFFVTTRWLEKEGEYWWDLLGRVLHDGADLPRALDVPAASGSVRLPTGSAAERRAARARLHRMLVEATLAEREAIVELLQSIAGPAPGEVRPMTADELLVLARMPGVSIGAHSVNHLSLAHQPEEVVRRELSDSRTTLQRVLGRAVDDFAYPYGAVNRGCMNLARRSWRWSVACDDQPVADAFDAARVRRLEPGEIDASSLAARLDACFACRQATLEW